MNDARLNGTRALVLVVEDEALIRLMLADALGDADYEVLEAENAAQAMDALIAETGIVAVVSDIRMPGEMDGLGLAQWVREHRPAAKVMLTSGFISDADQQALAGSFDCFIGKPYRVDAVVEELARLLS